MKLYRVAYCSADAPCAIIPPRRDTGTDNFEFLQIYAKHYIMSNAAAYISSRLPNPVFSLLAGLEIGNMILKNGFNSQLNESKV